MLRSSRKFGKLDAMRLSNLLALLGSLGLAGAFVLSNSGCSRKPPTAQRADTDARDLALSVTSSSSELPPTQPQDTPTTPGARFAEAMPDPHAKAELLAGPAVGNGSLLVELDGVIFAAVNPNLAQAPGGVYRSDDRGRHFRRASNGLPRLRDPIAPDRPTLSAFGQHAPISALAVDHGVLLAGTHRLQILRSIDQGTTWTLGTGMPNPAPKPDYGNRIGEFAVLNAVTFARSEQGVFRSTDRGATWEKVVLWAPQGFEQKLNRLIAHQGILYAGYGGGVLVSEDEGAHFRVSELPEEPFELLGQDAVVYAATAGQQRVFRSSDRGKTFRELTAKVETNGVDQLRAYAYQLRLPATASNLLYSTEHVFETSQHDLFLGSFRGIFITRDRGVTLKPPEAGPTGDGIAKLAVSTSRLFMGLAKNKGGFYTSPLDEYCFRRGASGGNELTAVATSGSEVLMGDEQGRLFRSRDEGKTWKAVTLPRATPLGPVEIIASQGKNRLLLRGGILISRDGGEHWRDIRAGFPIEPVESPPDNFTHKLSTGVVTERAVLIGGPTGIIRGGDDEDWMVIELPGTTQAVVALASDEDRIHAATRTTLFVSMDEGRSFQVLADSLPAGLTISEIGAAAGELVVIATNELASSPDSGVQILFSRDRGKTWWQKSKGLDLLPTSTPSRAPRGWYVGLESEGLWYFSVGAEGADL